MVVAVYLAFSAAAHWAFPNPLRIAFVVGAAAVVFQIAVLIEHARRR